MSTSNPIQIILRCWLGDWGKCRDTHRLVIGYCVRITWLKEYKAHWEIIHQTYPDCLHFHKSTTYRLIYRSTWSITSWFSTWKLGIMNMQANLRGVSRQVSLLFSREVKYKNSLYWNSFIDYATVTIFKVIIAHTRLLERVKAIHFNIYIVTKLQTIISLIFLKRSHNSSSNWHYFIIRK